MAKQMGISEGNARVKLNRAKEKLKELINKKATLRQAQDKLRPSLTEN